MNAEGQHERQRIGQAKCQRGVVDHRTPGHPTTIDDSTRLIVDPRKIKKERNCPDGTNENGTSIIGNNLHTGNNESIAGSSENGHQNSRNSGNNINNNVCRNISNGFHAGEILQDIIAAKFAQGSAGHGHGNANKNDKIRLMIEDSLSEDSKSRVQEIFLQVEQLNIEEKFLLYLRLPGSLTNPGGAVDPLRQPLNPLGNRYEIHQTIMWIKTHLEEDPDVSLPKQEVYDEYNMFCIRNSMKPLSTADFGKVMKQVYPRVRPRRLGTRGNSRYCYAGMRKRVKLDTPALPAVTDTSAADDFEEPITEEMLGAASTLIREWAESLLSMKFPTLSALARHLVDNLCVDTRSLAAVCILCASGDSQPSSNNKVSETSPSLSVTPVAGKPGKLREAQLQLQRKLQQREHIRDQKHRHQDAVLHNQSRDKSLEGATATTPVAAASTIATAAAGRSSTSSVGKGWKKSKTSQSPQCSGATTCSTGTGTGATTPGPSPKVSSQPTASASPATTRTRKLPRSASQAAVISPQLNCDSNAPKPQQSSRNSDESRNNSSNNINNNNNNNNSSNNNGNNGLSRSCTPSENVSVREIKFPAKNSRKRASLDQSRQNLSESSPEKQQKLMGEAQDIVKTEETGNLVKLPALQRNVDKISVVLPSSLKVVKTEPVEITAPRRVVKSKESEVVAGQHENNRDKTANGRSSIYENVTGNNRLEDKLCTIDPDALDDYLNGGNNSQEQEEELLQYFQQSSSSSSDAEANSNALSCGETDHASRSDKVSQLRLILQQNLKAGIVRQPLSGESITTNATMRRGTPVAEVKGRDPVTKQHDIILPTLLNHHSNHAASGTRRRVSFETSVVEQHAQHHETASNVSGGNNSTVNTVPQSPNTRRRIFNFTPISPGPHSPINGRAASASKPNSANASPFVSPRNTPVPRSRSNLQGGICRSRGNQKSLARSISCSVPYTNVRNETFVVPTSSADNARLLSVSQSSLVCPRTSAEVQVGGNLVHGTVRLITEHQDERKVLPAGCTASFLAGGDLNPQKQLLINYPSQENLQEIKNVYGSNSTAHRSRNNQPADQEISELLNGAVKQQPFTTEQLYYRSQSVPLHRMVNPTLMSPIAGNQQQYLGSFQSHSFNPSSNSSIAPTPVPSEFNDFGSIGGTEPYLLDDVDAGFIADEQQFLMEDKEISPESITKILNILDEEDRQIQSILPDGNPTEDNLIESTALTISMLDPLPDATLDIQPETIMDPAAVLDPSVGGNLQKIIESRSYPNTPLPLVATNSSYAGPSFTEDNSNGSRSYPSTPLHSIQSQDVYRESNEPMLSSPTLNSLNLRTESGETASGETVCRNVTDLLEPSFLGDPDADADDLDPLGNFDGLQDVDSLAPLFNEVTDTNR